MFNCFPQKSFRVFTDLLSKNETTRREAKDQLEKIHFRKKDLPRIYEAIKKEYPDDTDEYFSTKEKLLHLLWDVNDTTTITFVEELYPLLPPKDHFQFSTLRILSQMNTEKSVKSLLKILKENPPAFKNSSNVYTLFVPFYQHVNHSQLLFPSIFELLKKDQYIYYVYCLALEYRSKGVLSDSIFIDIKDQIKQDYYKSVSHLEQLKADQDEFIEARDLIVVLIDVMGSITNDTTILNILQKSIYNDYPQISLYASLSLLRRGHKVPDEIILKIASNPQLRLSFYDELTKLQLKHLFPSQFLTQYSFAEADMVSWLCFPTEFGRPPLKIELIETKELEAIS